LLQWLLRLQQLNLLKTIRKREAKVISKRKISQNKEQNSAKMQRRS